MLASGLSLAWGVMNEINIAHGSIAILGSYVAYWALQLWGIDPVVSIAISVPFCLVLGAALQQFVNMTSTRIPQAKIEFYSYLIFFGMLFISEGLMVAIWGGRFRAIRTAYNQTSVFLGPIALPLPTLIGFVFGTALTLAVYYSLKKTYTGMAVRATADDREIAMAMGINTHRIYVYTFAIGSGLAAIGGMCLGLLSIFYPDIQFYWITRLFAIVVLGGMGNLLGTYLGSLILGVAVSLTTVFTTASWADVVAYVMLIIVLTVRPKGLFGAR